MQDATCRALCERICAPQSMPNDLALKSIIARQDDAATVEERQEIGLFSALTEGNLQRRPQMPQAFVVIVVARPS